MFTNKWMREENVYRHPMEYYSDLIKKEILACTKTWIKLEDNLLSQISWSQKDKYYMILLTQGSKLLRFIETESRMMMVITRGRGEVGWTMV